MIKRRDFLKMIGGIGAYVLMPFSKIAHLFPSTYFQQNLEKWELYEGFLLLFDDGSLPDFVQCAPAPILGQVDDENDPLVISTRGDTLWFTSLEELIEKVPFPIYIPKTLPVGMGFVRGYIIYFRESREIFEIRCDFGNLDKKQQEISVSSRPVYSRPYPVKCYSNRQIPKNPSPEVETVQKSPEKVNFTPTPGLMISTDRGNVLQWIKSDILFTLFVDYDPNPQEAINIANTLTVR